MKTNGLKHFYRNHVRSISSKQKNNFFRQMGILTGAGITILKALKMIQKSSRGSIKSLLKDAIALIEQGSDFSRIGHFYPKFFDKMTLSMIAAGEKSGNLATIFREIHNTLEKKSKFKRKIIGAMMMPLFTFLLAVGVVFFMAIKVIPEFAKFLATMGSDLPELTKIVLDISTFLLENWKDIALYSGGGLAAFVVVYKLLKSARYFLDYLLIYTPLIGPIVLFSALANFSNSMAKLIGSGVSLVESLNISSEGVNLMPMKKVLENVKSVILSGGNFSVPFESARFVPVIYADILQAGEESGSLDEALHQLGLIYEEETNQKINILQAAITPIMTVLIGGIVGVIAASLIMGMVAVWASTGG